jgi:hypothetical protein
LTSQSNSINRESNSLNAESRDIQRQTQALAESTITLNTEIRKLNEESTAAARANQADAAKTSLSTRVNVEVDAQTEMIIRARKFADMRPAALAYYTLWHGTAVLWLRERHILLHTECKDICILDLDPYACLADPGGSLGALWKIVKSIPVENTIPVANTRGIGTNST